jgi:uncharacterized protein YjbI with pentapeptide repeats
MDFTSPWTILAVGAALLAATVVPGLYLWWPTRSKELAKSDLGLALMTGALIAFSVVLLEFLLAQRANRLESERQGESEKQALQLLVGRQRNLSGIDLGGEVLNDFYLNGKDLTGANLRGSSLRRARLQDAVLVETILVRSHLEDSRLEGAHLERAILDGAHLDGAHLRGARLQGARLRGAYLLSADLDFAVVRADLAGARLMGARFFGADLGNANLRGAKLQRADLRFASLTGANLAGADLRKAKVGGADFTNARYDAATRWPHASGKWPECRKTRCVVRERGRPKADVEIATLRATFERCLPDGWVVSPRDPAGFTFKSAIYGARFFGEQHAKAPGSGLAEFAQDWRDAVRSEYPGFRQREFRAVPVDVGRPLLKLAEGRAWINRFEYQEPNADGRGTQTWEQFEVYGITEDAGYRFFGRARSDIFMLFDRDFGELFSTVGLHPRSAFQSLDGDARICRRGARVRSAGAE